MRLSHIVFWLVAFGFWLAFSAATDVWHLAVGAVVATVAAVLFGGAFTLRPARMIDPRRWFWFAIYVAVFLWECGKANVDVAYRVLHPDLPIRPGIVRIRTHLASDIARTLLANSVTMTPGTLSVDLVGETIYVHWINVTTRDVEEATDRIASRFERLLARAFD